MNQLKQQGTKVSTIIPDDYNPSFLFSTVSTILLLAIANGEIDSRESAWLELRKRGLNATGEWVGFGPGKCEKPF